jgi:hypothetical protein
MSQKNVEIVRKATEAFNRRDRDAWLRLMYPEVEWWVGTFRGGRVLSHEWFATRDAAVEAAGMRA